MREIKFRGKNKYDGKFVYGFPHIEYTQDINHQEYPKHYICGHHECVCTMDNYKYRAGDKYHSSYSSEVIPETVGQFTGLLDKNGKEIYEGDIVRCWDGLGKDLSLRREYRIFMTVNYCNLWTSFVVEDKPMKMRFQIWKDFIAFEVVGNIHDNPELLTEK